jgi:hypothetical protein
MHRILSRLPLLLLCAVPLGAQNAGGRPVHNEAERLARWKPVEIPFHSAGLSARERQMVDKLVEACQLLDSVFWRQNDFGGLTVYKATRDRTLKDLLGIMGGRWDLLDRNHFILGEVPMPPGHEWFPHDLTRAQLDQYLAQHPEDRAAIYDPYTVVRWQGSRLTAVKYHDAYKVFLDPMAKALREAAALSDDQAFANFLRLRADALLTDDYYASDLAWLDLKSPRIDLIFAPYETYTDDLLGVKTTYGASILIRNEAESRKLAVYEKYVPDIQDALPLGAADRPSKRGHLSPMEVMDAPYRAGDLLHGYQAVADNLPNDPRLHEEKGSKKIFFKDFGDARVNYIILPLAQKLMTPAQAAKVSADGYLAGSLMHEIAHDLGPAFAHREGRQIAITEALGATYSGLEEAKADAVGMFGMKWLVDHRAMTQERLEEGYASYVAGLLRTLRFGAGEAHGRAETMEFNYLVESRAVTYAGGRYTIDYARMPDAIAALAKELLETESTGDRARADAWFGKYDKVPPELKTALAGVAEIPVDIRPIFSFPERVQ